MNLPKFLIIGAMKSGTTTLYDDLRQHPSVFFPIDKEPDFFSSPESTKPEAVAAYAKMFARAKPDQLCAEASTSYTKRPTYEGVAERAKAVLGDGLKAIYIVRDPVRRAISHHHHDHVLGLCDGDINKAATDHSVMIDYSKYAYQVDPWIEALGRDNVMLIRFEDYMSERQKGMDAVCKWLGIDQHGLKDPTKQLNASSGKPYHTGLWTTIAHSWAYRKVVRPFLPIGLKSWFHRAVLPKAPSKLAPASKQTLELLVESLSEQARRTGEIMGQDGPAWDLNKHLHKAESIPAAGPEKASA